MTRTTNSPAVDRLVRQRKVFEYAGAFSLLTPFLYLGLSEIRSRLPADGYPLAHSMIALAAITLVTAGLVMGIVALRAMRTHGSDRILWRSTFGLALNGSLLAAYVTSMIMVAFVESNPAAVLNPERVGRWQRTTADRSVLTLELFGDETFRMVISGDSNLDVGGSWDVARRDTGDPTRYLRLRVETVSIGRQQILDEVVLMEIILWDPHELVVIEGPEEPAVTYRKVE